MRNTSASYTGKRLPGSDLPDLAQAMNYLECYKLEVGLLLNFGAQSLEFKRVHNNKVDLD